MTNIKRVDAGVPTGGQFASTSHPESTVSLTKRPELEGWPEELPEPHLDFSLGSENAVTTTLTVEGQGEMEIFVESPGDHRCERTIYEGNWDVDEDLTERAFEWAQKKHFEIADDLSAVMTTAVDNARYTVVSNATGRIDHVPDDKLEELITSSRGAIRELVRQEELATASLAARRILAEHPEAATLVVDRSFYDDGEAISGGTVYTEDGIELCAYEYQLEKLENPEQDIHSLITSFPAESDAHWTTFNLQSTRGFNIDTQEEDLDTLDLRAAAAWNPGAAR